ncbi:MAG: peptidylprolyl isomerase [Candidatus Eisenbacteria bacterium]
MNSKPIRGPAVSLLAAALLLVSCGGKTSEKADPVLITVDGTEITNSDVEHELARLTRHLGERYTPAQVDQMRAQLGEQARENLIHKVLLAKAADEENVRVEEADLVEKIDQFRNSLPDTNAYTDYLRGLGLDDEAFRAEVREETRIERLLDAKTEEIPAPDEAAVRDYYETNHDRFMQGERVHAGHILVLFEEGDTDSTKKEKRSRIEGIRREIAGGADFTEMARKHSGCPSSANGGDLGWFERGRMVKPFEDAAFALRPGEMSRVVETEFGYHLIRLAERKEAREIPLAEVQEAIATEMTREAHREAVQNYLRSLRDSADIRILGSAG